MDLTKAMELFQEIRRRVQKHQSDFSEFRTRILLIDPVLRLLGWDVENPDLVVLEYQPSTRKRQSADYILKNNEENVAIVEAKNIDKKIDDLEYREQADNYARYAGAQFFIVTNGITWLLYERTLKTGFELLEPIVSFDVVHDKPYQCALAAISMWRPNLASDGGASEVAEPVFISSESAPDQPSSQPNEQQEQQQPDDLPKDDDKRYPFAAENRLYPQGTKPTRLKIGDHVDKQAVHWLDVIHEVVAWLIYEEILSDNHCPIEIGKKTFINSEAVNRDGTPFKTPRQLPKGLILQRSVRNRSAMAQVKGDANSI